MCARVFKVISLSLSLSLSLSNKLLFNTKQLVLKVEIILLLEKGIISFVFNDSIAKVKRMSYERRKASQNHFPEFIFTMFAFAFS